MDISNLTIKEKEQAKQNGFVLLGKTGAGKSTLLNAMSGKEAAKVDRNLESVTQDSSIYYYKLDNGKCISIIDTPGLSDSSKIINNKDIDNEHLKGIKKKIFQENIHIKGILFLVNFQNERFDSDEQEALINYNTIFPLKQFWTHIIIVFTHHFADPDGDTEEDMKKGREKSNGEIFSKLMNKVKEVSDVIDYKNLNIKYFNSYSPPKTDKQKEKNKLVKDELEIEISKLCQKEPLFSKVEILNIDNYKIEENGKKYLCKVEVTAFFDLNLQPLKKDTKILSKREIKDNEKIPKRKIEGKVYSGKRDANDNIIHKEEVATEENSYLMKILKTGGEMTLLSLIGGTIGAFCVGTIFAPEVAISATIGGSIALIKKLFS
jgi:GTPase Era involved in 16S rRNA processing